MPISPGKDETQSDWMTRCVPEMIGTGADKRPQEQAVAICLDIWRNKQGGLAFARTMEEIIAGWKKIMQKQDFPEPDDDETEDDFMERCVDELSDVTDDPDYFCQLAWEDYASERSQKTSSRVVHKTHAADVQGMEFVLSDETPDRMGDVIMSDGWDTTAFRRNPVALFNHKSDFPIGKWRDLRIENKALRGHLELAPEGTSERIDEIRRLVKADILRAVSVGFRSIEEQPLDPKNPLRGGSRFVKQELVETSLVSVPANPNALAIAKSLQISTATMDLVFAGHGRKARARRRGVTGGHAESDAMGKGKKSMTPLSQRVAEAETRYIEARDALEAHLSQVDDENVSDADLETTSNLNVRVAQCQKARDALRSAEQNLMGSISSIATAAKLPAVIAPRGNGASAEPIHTPFVARSRSTDLEPMEYVLRAGVAQIYAKIHQCTVNDARRACYGDDEPTRMVLDWTTRAATAPAMTNVPGWAQELAIQIMADYMDLLYPKAIFPRLSAKGLALTFGRANKIVIPMRAATPTIAGSFVGEGQPIPVRQGAFTSVSVLPKKMAVITYWSRELDEHSIPAIEGLLRDIVRTDTGIAIDSVLIDANPATTVRPAGILNGVVATTATAGGGLTALVGDIKGLMNALIAATKGNLREPTLMMNPGDVNSAKLTASSIGTFPFRDELNAGNLNGIPVIDSGTVPVKTMILIDAADFVSVGAEGPRFEVSDQAVIHEEDTAPLPIVTGATPTVASPVRSLWQTDSLALRLILPLNWIIRRAGVVAFTQNVTWA